ncbi:MAG: glycoside hydrolase family 30 protein [Flavobacteriaceae bacterium]
MKNFRPSLLFIYAIYLCLFFLMACGPKEGEKAYRLEIYQTAQNGDQLKQILPSSTATSLPAAQQLQLQLLPEKEYQEYVGFGASFTESSAWNLATLPEEKRKAVLTQLFSPSNGAGFSLTRTHINSSDYSNQHYTYVNDKDETLASFSIAEDLKGFNGDENDQVAGIKLENPSYDLIPMILEAAAVPGANFKIIASPWSPPSWMKSGETATMTNGSLKREYYDLWATYLSKYISAYKEKGIDLWGITPQNEPLHAHDARWDSNGFSPEEGRDFLRDHLGPRLVKDGHLNLNQPEEGIKVLIYDHNKSNMNAYISPTYSDPAAALYAWGTAFHWYASSQLEEQQWHADALEEHQRNWPNKGMIHTESSIDIDPKDPIGQYWRESPDYAGTFIPFDTYAYDIITDLNHGTQGYIEWCMILSHEGKPNPYDNFNSAPVLINPHTHEVTYTPLYYLLSHFSQFIRPKAKRIGIAGKAKEGIISTAANNPDGSIALVIFNRTDSPQQLQLSLLSDEFKIEIHPRALQTLVLRPNKS